MNNLKQDLIDWLLFLLVATVVGITFITHARSEDSEDSEAEYLARAKAAIAINISLSKGSTDAPESPADTPTLPQSTVPVLPEIYVIYAPFPCGPCDQQRSDLKAWKNAPFVFRTPVDPPIPVESYPVTAWRVGNKWWHFSGWYGREHLLSEWKRSQSQPSKSAPTASAPLNLKSFAASYNGPMTGVRGGDYWSHLLEHGFSPSQINGLTQAEAAKIHGAVHAGFLKVR